MNKLLAIMVGGAIGAVLRYFVSTGSAKLFGSSFPWGTLIVNTAGCLMIGVALGVAQTRGMDEHLRLFFVTGFLGALTTFSTFSFETIEQARQGAILVSLTNVLANNMLGIAAAYLGYWGVTRTL